MKQIKIYAHRQPWLADGIDILISHASGGSGEPVRRFIMDPLPMRELKSPDDGVMPPPTLCLSGDAAQQLMDRLWDCGLRPTEGSGSAGALAATERHLKDMQSISFQLLNEVSTPKPS